MTPKTLAALSLLAVSACAPDSHGDLREHTVVHPPGSPSRITFVGLGAGSPDGAFAQTFGYEWMATFVADYGTTVHALEHPAQDAYRPVTLRYEGNPLALRKLADRWTGVLEAAGARCDECEEQECSCTWKDGDEALAVLDVERRWYGVAQVDVTLLR
jgi:hypothetical protein